jgi:ribosomal-protein-alanine N-acetyltransferase
MSAIPKSTRGSEQFPLQPMAPMQVDDLGEVQEIENDIYPYPWTRGNFLDSLYSGYETWTLRDARGALLAYVLVMPALDEAHVLNLTVRRDLQGKGLGRMLLDQVVTLARERKMSSLLLEVRPSNLRAQTIYSRYGFEQIGRRRGYYPAANNGREDAIVMRMPL